MDHDRIALNPAAVDNQFHSGAVNEVQLALQTRRAVKGP
jgi:hypothetical protein